MSFKLAHLSDWHSGYRSGKRLTEEGINLREQDGYDAMREIVDDVINNECDAAVFCGDTMHVPNPDIRALITVQNELRRLAASGVKVYVLAGNHDTNDIRADIAASKIFDDPWRGIYSHAEPYKMHEIGDGINLHMISHHMFSDQEETMLGIKPVEGQINIFSTHGSVIDPLLQEKLHTEQSPREIVIPDFMFDDFDWNYALLGHIHERGWVGSKDKKTDTSNSKVYYNGSAIRRGFSDKNVPLGRGWTLWTIEGDGTMKAEPKTVKQRRQLDFKIINAADLTASEVTDEILSNLRDTQIDGTAFLEESAPILRQQITNISPSKHAALDWATISRESAHAMMWAIKLTTLDSADKTDTDPTALSQDDIAKNSDVVQVYDGWIENSIKLAEVDEGIKEKTKKRARKYVKKGQEENLNNE